MSTCPTCGHYNPTDEKWFIEWEKRTIAALKKIAGRKVRGFATAGTPSLLRQSPRTTRKPVPA